VVFGFKVFKKTYVNAKNVDFWPWIDKQTGAAVGTKLMAGSLGSKLVG
jgi:hypothetical protein